MRRRGSWLTGLTEIRTGQRAERMLTKRVRNGPTWDVRPVGREILQYAVFLDESRLYNLAVRAGSNKRGRAKFGPVVVAITGRHPEKPAGGGA